MRCEATRSSSLLGAKKGLQGFNLGKIATAIEGQSEVRARIIIAVINKSMGVACASKRPPSSRMTLQPEILFLSRKRGPHRKQLRRTISGWSYADDYCDFYALPFTRVPAGIFANHCAETNGFHCASILHQPLIKPRSPLLPPQWRHQPPCKLSMLTSLSRHD